MFSELVDRVGLAAGRPDRKEEIAGAVNRVLKVAHGQQYYLKDLVETPIVSTSQDHQWDLPRYYRTMLTVRYGAIVYPRNLQPGRVQRNENAYWYQISTYIIFVGAGVGTTIALAYYKTSKNFTYYPVGERPAVFDEETAVWSYLQTDGSYGPSLATPEEEEAAREKVSSWMLNEWRDIPYEGALAEIFKLTGDQRTRTHFANYNSLLETQAKTEMIGSLGR